jgi:hypothetical protein
MDDPATTVADIQLFPSGDGLNLLAKVVAGIESMIARRVFADAHPSVRISRLVSDASLFFHKFEYWLVISTWRQRTAAAYAEQNTGGYHEAVNALAALRP